MDKQPYTMHVVSYQTALPAQENPDRVPGSWMGDSFWVGGNMNIQGAHAGALIDTWTADTYLNNGYKYHVGNPLCISIYNNTDEPKKFEIGLEDTIGQPDGFQDWITVADYYPSVPARTVADVPIKIVIPDSAASIHGNFEFRIYVVSSEGSIQSAGAIRIFVSMR
jgi:hypothetical protein